MTPTRRGQVEVQFNWIFVLIVGVIILSFFIVLAMRQKEASEQNINIGFFVNFEKAVSGVSAVEGKTLLFEIPAMDLRYDCTSACDCAAYAGLSRAKTQSKLFRFDERIIFSPNRIKGNNLLTWSKDWSYPFRITNFLLMTSPEVKYLIEDSSLGRQLFKDLPPPSIEVEQVPRRAFDKQLFTANDLVIENITGNYKVKFVFTDTDPTDTTKFSIPLVLYDLDNSDVTAVRIKKAAGSPEVVVFYQKKGGAFEKVGESYLFGEATRFAAIFAEDLNTYTCTMNKALKTFNMVSNVYSEKMDIYLDYFKDLKEQIPPNPEGRCTIHYLTSTVGDIPFLTEDFDFEIQNDKLATDIAERANSISQQNENAIQDSCPHIY